MKINKDTLVYGSFSSNPGNNGCIFFNDAFEKYNINAIYKSFYSTDAESLIKATKHLNFAGFALSMPLKIDIMKYLDEIDPAALEIGAVNTVVNKDGKYVGYNTDWIGVYNYFTETVAYLPKSLRNSMYGKDSIELSILGNGGFSKAVQYSCKKLEINYEIITRKTWKKIPDTQNTIFNATPVDVKSKYLIDGRPFTEDGKKIANLQAAAQFYLYTGIKYEK